MSATVYAYVSIGNSDDKLTQAEWAEFQSWVDREIRSFAVTIHGAWVSLPRDPWQNACWCFEVAPLHVGVLQRSLVSVAKKFRQDSIAWAQARLSFLSQELEETHGNGHSTR